MSHQHNTVTTLSVISHQHTDCHVVSTTHRLSCRINTRTVMSHQHNTVTTQTVMLHQHTTVATQTVMSHQHTDCHVASSHTDCHAASTHTDCHVASTQHSNYTDRHVASTQHNTATTQTVLSLQHSHACCHISDQHSSVHSGNESGIKTKGERRKVILILTRTERFHAYFLGPKTQMVKKNAFCFDNTWQDANFQGMYSWTRILLACWGSIRLVLHRGYPFLTRNVCNSFWA